MRGGDVAAVCYAVETADSGGSFLFVVVHVSIAVAFRVVVVVWLGHFADLGHVGLCPRA